MSKSYDVVGIGNAIVDVISHGTDDFLEHMGITKGIMQLVERERAELLYAAMSDRVQAPGGSVGNTLAGIGTLGLNTAFVGRVRNDALGQFYAEQMVEEGTAFPNPPTDDDPLPTSRSMIFVSPDGERSMNTYLGAGAEFSSDDVDPEVMENTRYLFLEGYLFDKDKGKTAFRAAAAACRHAGGQAGLTLSDPFCVDRHREAFAEMLKTDVDLLFANRAELLAMYGPGDFDGALQAAAAEVETVVCTESEHGAHVLRGPMSWHCPAVPTKVVDATGAGDLFAGGFMWGLIEGFDPETCGIMGNIAASEVISHLGARPEADLKARFRAFGLKV